MFPRRLRHLVMITQSLRCLALVQARQTLSFEEAHQIQHCLSLLKQPHRQNCHC